MSWYFFFFIDHKFFFLIKFMAIITNKVCFFTIILFIMVVIMIMAILNKISFYSIFWQWRSIVMIYPCKYFPFLLSYYCFNKFTIFKIFRPFLQHENQRVRYIDIYLFTNRYPMLFVHKNFWWFSLFNICDAISHEWESSWIHFAQFVVIIIWHCFLYFFDKNDKIKHNWFLNIYSFSGHTNLYIF